MSKLDLIVETNQFRTIESPLKNSFNIGAPFVKGYLETYELGSSTVLKDKSKSKNYVKRSVIELSTVLEENEASFSTEDSPKHEKSK